MRLWLRNGLVLVQLTLLLRRKVRRRMRRSLRQRDRLVVEIPVGGKHLFCFVVVVLVCLILLLLLLIQMCLGLRVILLLLMLVLMRCSKRIGSVVFGGCRERRRARHDRSG